MEHRAGVEMRSVAVIMVTSGLHGAPIPANEHRSSTGTSTCDRQRILSIACVQVRGLLRVRRQGLEPRTRGLSPDAPIGFRLTVVDLVFRLNGCGRRRAAGLPGLST